MRTGADARVLIVDDDDAFRRILSRILTRHGYTCVEAASATEAEVTFAAGPFALVLCDITMPGGSGLGLIRGLLTQAPDTAVVMVTGVDDPDVAEDALLLGAFGFLVKPFGSSELLIAVRNALIRRHLEATARAHSESLERLVQVRTEELVVSRDETIDRLARAIAIRDGETGAHVERMGRYCWLCATQLGLTAERCDLIRAASPLHDVGKIGIPDRILRKPGRLTPEERAEIQEHAELGRTILGGSASEVLELAATIAYTHHERVDGLGYPQGLVGQAIPLEGRIAAVADVFDALTSDRAYRRALSIDEAVGMITKERGTHFDADVFDAFMECIPHAERVRAPAMAQ
ncbi:MAG: HD domain-containing phosphohydrolase [Gaiellaceae bacterium]